MVSDHIHVRDHYRNALSRSAKACYRAGKVGTPASSKHEDKLALRSMLHRNIFARGMHKTIRLARIDGPNGVTLRRLRK